MQNEAFLGLKLLDM